MTSSKEGKGCKAKCDTRAQGPGHKGVTKEGGSKNVQVRVNL